MLIRSRKVYVLAANERQSKEFSFVSFIRQSKKNTMQSVDKMFRYFTPKQWVALFLIVIPLFFVSYKEFMIITSILSGVFLIIGIELDKKEDKGFKI